MDLRIYVLARPHVRIANASDRFVQVAPRTFATLAGFRCACVCVFTRILVGLRIELTGFFPTSSVIGVDLGGETATASTGSDLGTLDKAGSSRHHP